uniref:GH18 domain-containing protein n=1 Tax=Knipowitschia caucasica TaxID=637954 RepID=A0AAV2M8M9_KNICA
MAGCWPLLAALLLAHSTTTFKLVCHFANWSQYRTRLGKFTVEKIDPFLCSHVVYDFAVIDRDNKLTVNEESFHGALTGLKIRNPNLKTLLSVRELSTDEPRFPSMVSAAASRHVFAQSSVSFLRTHEFDGLELDWDHPGNNKYKFTQLCKAFENESIGTGRTRLTLSASLTPQKDVMTFDHYEVTELSKILDFLSVKTFDLSRGDVAAHHSPLFSTNNASMDFITQYFLDQKTPAEKLLVGFPTHTRSYALSTEMSSPGAPVSGPANPGPYTQEMGFWSHYETCTFLQGAAGNWIDSQYVPYAVNYNLWVGFDNQESYSAKVSYLRNQNLGGAAVWSMDLDDFDGLFCGKGNYPLISQLKAELSKDISATNKTLHQNTTAIPHSQATDGTIGTNTSCVNGITVVHPDSSLCLEKTDGRYQTTAAPPLAYVCVQGMAYVTECPTVHSRASAPPGALLVNLLLAKLLHSCCVYR